MLQVSPFLRPTCDKILKMEPVRRWADKLFPNLSEILNENNVLLKTIKPSENLFLVTDKLPKPNYDEKETIKNRSSDAAAFKLPLLKQANHPVKVNTRLRSEIHNIDETNEYSESLSPSKISNIKLDIGSNMKIKNISEERRKIVGSLDQQKYVPHNYQNIKKPKIFDQEVENEKREKPIIRRKLDDYLENSKIGTNVIKLPRESNSYEVHNYINEISNISSNKNEKKKSGISINNNLGINIFENALEIYGNKINQESLINYQKKYYYFRRLQGIIDKNKIENRHNGSLPRSYLPKNFYYLFKKGQKNRLTKKPGIFS